MSSSRREKRILWFEELGKEDIPLVGGKNANLGEMTRAGISVPPGFAITAEAYREFITETNIAEKIYRIVEETVTDIKDPKQYEEASKKVRQLIESTEMPGRIEKAIQANYNELSKRTKTSEIFVAVRSSATAEDLPDASFAGQQETYLNVKGADELVRKTVKCWSSLFTPRAIFYRTEKGFRHEEVLISVGVQKMVNSKVAGVTFTINPVSGESNQIVIEANWGLGESVVSGAVTPDDYVVNKSTLQIIEKRIAKKTIEYIQDPETGRTIHAEIDIKRQKIPCLADEEVVKLAEIAKQIEEHYGDPQDIEWAIDRNLPFPENIYIVQSRPETVWSLKKKGPPAEASRTPELPERPVEMKVVTKGMAAGKRSIGAGVAKIVFSPEDASKLMKKGDILVTDMTNPDYVPYMRMAGAIVTDKGGVTCHAAIVSRELGIPCVVGAENATKVMKNGNEYTVDARSGVIYEGIKPMLEKPAPAPTVTPEVAALSSAPVTATKIYLNLGVPDKIEDYKHLPFDGIGLMRIEFILASYIGDHPLFLLEKGQADKFVNQLAEGIATVARTIQPKPVVVRFSDFKTNEYRELKGGDKYEIVEANPMLGWRGASRYISKWYEKAFRLECKAIRKCREEWNLKNVWVMLPVIRTVWEAKRCLKIMKSEGLERNRDFQVWFMAETPAIAILADEFSTLCDGFSIGSNDLTQGVLMIDRDSERLGLMGYFDERDPAVKRIIAHLIKVAHQHGVTVSICGEGPSNLPDFTDFLVRCGIDSVSVNADAVVSTRQLVASLEQKVLLERLMDMQRKTTERPAQKSEEDFGQSFE
ncbi:MAG: phosphoenolpyruvate synthase [Candidatus Bathyarchaeota archaeon]|nr:phosphoenolpyruvate synthase [Candidatus Bathyarchaeota archaeon]